MSPKEVWVELKGGSTLAGLAEAQGVDRQALYDATIVRLTEYLDQAVGDGTLSQVDADGMLGKMQGVGVGILSK